MLGGRELRERGARFLTTAKTCRMEGVVTSFNPNSDRKWGSSSNSSGIGFAWIETGKVKNVIVARKKLRRACG